MKRRYSISIIFLFLLLGMPNLSRASSAYVEDYTIRASRFNGFNASNEVTGDEMATVLGAERVRQIWKDFFVLTSLEETYQKALDLEKKGDFSGALKLFQKIDDGRKTEWDWVHTSPRSRLAFREAGDRIELYSPARLSQVRLLKLYLSARQAYLLGKFEDASRLAKTLSQLAKTDDLSDKAGFQALTEYLRAVARAHTQESPDSFQPYVDQHPSARALFTLADLGLANEEGFFRDKMVPSLKRILKDFPQSRYADDACYLLASLAIAGNDWKGTQEYFQLLAEKYNQDDLVPKGRLMVLAENAVKQFEKVSTLQAFWELAGGEGEYLNQKDQWETLKPFYRPYFILAFLRGGNSRSDTYPYGSRFHKNRIAGKSKYLSFEKKFPYFSIIPASYNVAAISDDAAENTDPTEGLLKEVVQQKPSHPLRAEALLRLAWFYMGKIRYQWEKSGNNEKLKRSKAIYEELIEKYPRSPEAGSPAVEGLAEILRVEKANAYRLIPWIQKAHRYHVLSQGIFRDLGNFPGFKPSLLKDPQLDEMYCVAIGKDIDLLKRHPQSKFAPWIFLKLYNSLELAKDKFFPLSPQATADPKLQKRWVQEQGEMRRNLVGPLLSYAEWYLARFPEGSQADVVRIKRAKILLESGQPGKALTSVESILADPRGKAEDGGEAQESDKQGRRILHTGKNQQYFYWLDEAYWVRARALEALGRQRQALKAYEKLVEKFPSSKAPYSGGYGNGYDGWESWQSIRTRGLSPYTEYASSKIGFYYESKKDYVKALKIYSDANDANDCQYLLDGAMPVEDFNKFIGKYPEHPLVPTVERSLGMRYFRLRQFDKALEILKDSGAVKEVNEVKRIYEDIESETDPEKKAIAEYKAAQHFFFHRKSSYFNYNMIGKGPLADSSKEMLSLQGNMNQAAEGFKRVFTLYPKSLLKDRALYSYALAVLHQGSSDYGNVNETLTSDAVRHFSRIHQENPRSTLADDGLMWAYFFSRDDKYLVDLAKNNNHGDVLLLLNRNDIQSPGYYYSPYSWWEAFFRHNSYLRGTDFSTTSNALLLGSQLQDSFHPGAAYSGWYYYKATGRHFEEGQLDLNIQGAEGSKATVNFNGREMTLEASAPKNFRMKLSDLPPGVSQWIQFKVEEAGQAPLSVSGNIHSLIDGHSFDTPLDEVAAQPQSVTLKYEPRDFPVDQTCMVTTAFQNGGGSTQWAFKRNDGKTQVYQSYGSRIEARELLDQEVHQFLRYSDPNQSYSQSHAIYVQDLTVPLEAKRAVAYINLGWSSTGTVINPIFPLPPYGRYAHGELQVQGEYLVDDRGNEVAWIPGSVNQKGPAKVKKRPSQGGPAAAGRLANKPTRPPDPKIEFKAGGKDSTPMLVLSGLSAVGLDADVRYCDPGPDKVLSARYLGVDHNGKVYLFLRCPLDDKVEAFFPGGKSAGFFWLKDKMGKVDDLQKLRMFVFPEGKLRFFSFNADKKSIRFDEFLFDHVKSRNGYYE